jgi:RecA-family ATPase
MPRDDEWVEAMTRAGTYKVPLGDQPSANGTAPRGVFYEDAIEVKPERIEWLWRHRLALGKIVVLDGDPGLGKSTVSLDIAARVSSGAPFPMDDEGRTPAGVILLSAEDGIADTIVPRLAAAGADLGLVRILKAYPDERGMPVPLTIPAAIPFMEEHVRATESKLLIIDPLMAYFESKTNANTDQDVRAALRPLGEMLERTGCACLMLRHLNKSDSKNALYRGGGSIGIVGAARTGFIVTKHPDDDKIRILATSKNNLAPEAPSLTYHLESVWGQDVAHVVWANETTRYSAADLMNLSSRDKEDEQEEDDVEAFLRDYLEQNGPTRSTEIIKVGKTEYDYSASKIHRARKKLDIQSIREAAFQGAYVWHLPEQAPKPAKRSDLDDLPE